MSLPTEDIIDAQILVDVTNESGVSKIVLPDGQVMVWPAGLAKLNQGQYYLSLSPQPWPLSKEEVAKLVLREILQLE